jgi:hydroxypyruvate reductase
MVDVPQATLSEREARAREVRAQARDIFQHALSEATIAKAFEKHVVAERGTLRVADDLYDLSSYANLLVVSIGKAAHTMAAALAPQVGSRLSGIVAAPTDPEQQLPGIRYYRGGHPTPNAESLLAARAILRSLQNQTLHSLVIFLISGGGSAVVEKPFAREISLADIAATHEALVLSGAPIAAINAIRKHLSAVKGGRMALAAAPAQQVSILVSDVPDHALDALASGPTMPDSTTVDDCYEIAQRYGLLKSFPSSVRRLFEKRELEETPKPGQEWFARSRWWPVLSNGSAQAAAATRAAMCGFAVEVDNSMDDRDYAATADHLLKRLRKLRRGVSRACLISGGEVTVKVTNGGSGGRNQQFALYCATRIAGEDIVVLSAGTDGIDGNSPAAGAVVDGTTLERARAEGLDCAQALARFNAYPVFQQLGDAVVTGPSGNNLRDLRVLLAY